MVGAQPAAAHANDAMVIRLVAVVWWLLAGAFAGPVSAIESITISVEDIIAPDWQAEGIRWKVDLNDESATQLVISRLQLPGDYGHIDQLKLDCPGLVIEEKLIACPKGLASGQAPWLKDAVFELHFRYDTSSENLVLGIKGLPAFGGRFDIQGDYRKEWQLSLSADNVDAASLGQWLPAVHGLLPGWQFSGPLKTRLTYEGTKVRASLSANAVNFSDEAGRYAGEQLQTTFHLSAQLSGNRWVGEARAEVQSGQAYVEPVFVDFSSHPLSLQSDVVYEAGGKVELKRARLDQSSVLQASGQATLVNSQLQQADLAATDIRLDKAYAIYAQPFLLDTVLADLEVIGDMNVSLAYQEAAPQALTVSLKNVVLEDKQGRFSWDGVEGDVHWLAVGEAKPSSLRWQGGSLYKILFEASAIKADLGGQDIALLAPLRLPLLEGALLVNEFAAQGLGQSDMALQFDAELEPLSLEALTTALAWPAFGGELSGKLPKLDYRQGVLTLGGALQAEVFGGELRVEQLRMQDPFGRLPQLFANVKMRNLDLKAMTQAFSFGRIEGRLEGDIERLHLLNWSPVSFDARLQTPADDDSRRRISQRAIENISAIGGGGATAVLSRGFMQFFDDFAYERIGLSCRLRAGVCRMGGLGPGKNGQGYVLVKGRLLPRIDVVGYAQRVDWPTLVEQLQSVTKGDGPVLR